MAAWIFRIGPVVSEIRGRARNSPPSGARYKNTPVGRGLFKVCLCNIHLLSGSHSTIGNWHRQFHAYYHSYRPRVYRTQLTGCSLTLPLPRPHLPPLPAWVGSADPVALKLHGLPRSGRWGPTAVYRYLQERLHNLVLRHEFHDASLEGSMRRWFGQYCYKKALTSCKNVRD